MLTAGRKKMAHCGVYQLTICLTRREALLFNCSLESIVLGARVVLGWVRFNGCLAQ
jgi:hypothetical protein